MNRSPTDTARARMIDEQLVARGIKDQRVLGAMRRLPREHFVSPNLAERAYSDQPLPIGHGQTISQPYVVARMCELLALTGNERVLELGAGCGYQTALLAQLAREVFAVEIIPDLATRASRALDKLHIGNAHVDCFDGTHGWKEHAPYDAIVVSAGAPRVPALLLDQLADDGRLVAPIGEREHQVLTRVVRLGDEYETHSDVPVRFVDLIGRYGWGPSGPPAA